MEELFLFLDELVKKTLLSSSEIDKTLWKISQGFLKKFPIDENGKVDYNERSQLLIVEMSERIEKELQKTGYKSLVSSVLTDFDLILSNNQEIQKELTGIEFSKNLINNLNKEKQLVVNATTAFLGSSGVNANIIFPIQKTLIENASLGYSFNTFEKKLRERIIGDEKLAGTVERYVGQVTRDSLYQYDGVINQSVAIEYGLNAFRYVGTVVGDTRPQCKKWLKQKLLKESELGKEISWAKKNGSGMIPATNKENFIVYRGGYNCRHRAIPILIEE